MKYRATLEYRDEWTRGRWSTTSATASDKDDAVAAVFRKCCDCEHRNLTVEEVEE